MTEHTKQTVIKWVRILLYVALVYWIIAYVIACNEIHELREQLEYYECTIYGGRFCK